MGWELDDALSTNNMVANALEKALSSASLKY